MRSSPSLWFAIVCGVIGCALLITGTFTGFWLHIYAADENESANLIFGLFSICVETLNVPQKCISLDALTGSFLVWRACAIGSWLALGVAVICSGFGIRATGRRGVKRAAIILSVKSVVAAVIVIGVFTTGVQTALSQHSYNYHGQAVDVQVSYAWSFYLFIVGTVFGALSAIAVIISVVTDPPAEGMGGVVMRQHEPIKPRCGVITVLSIPTTYHITPHNASPQCTITYTYTTNSTLADPTIQSAVEIARKHIHNPLHIPPETRAKIVKNLEKDGAKLTVEDGAKSDVRFLADGLLSDKVCARMIAITNFAIENSGYEDSSRELTPEETFSGLEFVDMTKGTAIEGDGYESRKPQVNPTTEQRTSPHTLHERFSGLTVWRVYELVLEGQMSIVDLETYLTISDRARAMVESYFNLQTPLYFDFTHLVCRQAIDGDNVDREDLSHPIHGDNCHIQKDGSCLKEPPAYIQRDYSALLYLNDDFVGGEIFFAHNNLSVEHMVSPKCGRLIGFESSQYHGVKAVISGRRCAVAMWYTLDPRYKEIARILAYRFIDDVRTGKVTLDHYSPLSQDDVVTHIDDVDADVDTNVDADVDADVDTSVDADVGADVDTDVDANVDMEKESGNDRSVEIDVQHVDKIDLEVNLQNDDSKKHVEDNIERDKIDTTDIKMDREAKIERETDMGIKNEFRTDLEVDLQNDASKIHVEDEIERDKIHVKDNIERDKIDIEIGTSRKMDSEANLKHETYIEMDMAVVKMDGEIDRKQTNTDYIETVTKMDIESNKKVK